jgi:hypothetical protein
MPVRCIIHAGLAIHKTTLINFLVSNFLNTDNMAVLCAEIKDPTARASQSTHFTVNGTYLVAHKFRLRRESSVAEEPEWQRISLVSGQQRIPQES